MTPESLVNVLEAALLAAGRALTLDDLLALFIGSADAPDRKQLRDALAQLEEDLSGRGIELVEVASGYRLQVRKEYSSWLAGLFSERPPRYSRALLETLALITYRQPITRGEIEDVRGVAVSSNIIKTLMEREWIRVLGHREVPGRPALYGTTREFLDHFGLKSLEGLPPLADIRDLDQVAPDLFAPAAADVNDPKPDSGEDELASISSEADPGIDASGDKEAHDGDHEHRTVAGDEQQGSELPAAEDATIGDAMPGESAVNETEADDTQVVEGAAVVDLGGGNLDTGLRDDAAPVVGQSSDSDEAADVSNEDGDNETASSINEEGDVNLDTGPDEDASLAVGQFSEPDHTDEVPDEDGDSETSSSIEESADANDASVVSRSAGEGADEQGEQDESVSEHIDEADRGELDGRR